MSFGVPTLGLPLQARRYLQDSDPCSVVVAPVSDFDRHLRLASIFILFAASALGVAAPLVPKYSQKFGAHQSYLIVLGKCAGTGVMLSCSLVHMVLPSTEALTSDCLPAFFSSTYPAFSFVFALLAVLISHLIEHLLVCCMSGGSYEGNGIPIRSTTDEEEKGVSLSGKALVEDLEDTTIKQAHSSAAPPVGETAANDDGDDDDNDNAKLQRARHLTESLLAEFSLSVHSVFVGIAVGVSDGSALVALLIALVFHQILEGVALGCRLADGAVKTRTAILFGAIFSVSCPLGVVVGIGVYRTLNANGEAYLLAQGAFDGLCGGLLLYTGFQLLLRDFPRDLEHHCNGKRRHFAASGMFAALWLSALAMSVIGAWA